MLRYRLGTTGYAYADWQQPFYPAGAAQGKWLGIYASQFDCVELNTTFHAEPTVDRLRRWAGQVGSDFRFALKTSRAITHDQPLADGVPPMLRFVETVRALGTALGPVLIQLPPHCSISSFDALDRLLGALPMDVRYAVEFRHASWVQDRTTDMLRHHAAAWVGLDHLDHPHLRRLRATTDFLYIRLIGRHNRFSSNSHELVDVVADLEKWQAAIGREVERSQGQLNEVWVLAGNDYAGHAPGTLRRFASVAGIALAPAMPQAQLFTD